MNIRVFEEKIVTLQRKLEDLLGDDEELRMKASKGKCSEQQMGQLRCRLKRKCVFFLGKWNHESGNDSI